MPISTSTPLPIAAPFRHRGFGLAVRKAPWANPAVPSFGFTISDAGLTLHTSHPEFRSPSAADRAARRFIDDALGAYDYATQAIAA